MSGKSVARAPTTVVSLGPGQRAFRASAGAWHDARIASDGAASRSASTVLLGRHFAARTAGTTDGTQRTVPRASFQQLPVQRRAEILAIAAEEFGARGFQATSYNQLLQRLGIGKSSAYHYFEDESGLFRSAVAESYAKWFRGSSPLTQPRAVKSTGRTSAN